MVSYNGRDHGSHERIAKRFGETERCSHRAYARHEIGQRVRRNGMPTAGEIRDYMTRIGNV